MRYQAVAAIANIGTDDTVGDLVESFHHDAARVVRIDGGGCGLAHCGMLTRAPKRMLAIPALIEMVEDPLLDAETVKYGYRALRGITDETLPDSSRQWREWFAARGAETTERFRQFDDSERPDPHPPSHDDGAEGPEPEAPASRSLCPHRTPGDRQLLSSRNQRLYEMHIGTRRSVQIARNRLIRRVT